MGAKAEGRIFRFSTWDLVHIAALAADGVLIFWIAANFASLTWITYLLLAVLVILMGFMAQHAIHYQSHTPFFHSRVLNRALTVGISFLHRNPFIVYKLSHRFHHRHTIDWSRFGLAAYLELGSRREVLTFPLTIALEMTGIRYVAYLRIAWKNLHRDVPHSGTFRRDGLKVLEDIADRALPFVAYDLKHRGRPAFNQMALETVAALALNPVLIAVSWQFWLFFFVPVKYVYRMASSFAEYWEHAYVVDEDDHTCDAVSCYQPIYNLLQFNNGYHQEHTVSPGVHWTKVPALRAKLPRDSERRVVPIVPWIWGPPASAQDRRKPDGVEVDGSR